MFFVRCIVNAQRCLSIVKLLHKEMAPTHPSPKKLFVDVVFATDKMGSAPPSANTSFDIVLSAAQVVTHLQGSHSMRCINNSSFVPLRR